MEGTTLKSKVVNIVLGVVLVISVVGNIYIVKLSSDAKEEAAAIRDQLTAAEGQVVDLEGQLAGFNEVQEYVAGLQGQLADFEKVQTEVSDLQKQLTESKDLIESLESTITEQNIIVANLEEQRANQEQLLLAAQPNAKKPAQNGNGGGQNSSNDTPELSGDPSTWPCIPGYEYKPGTEYVYPLGWIINNGGTGTVSEGTMAGDQSACVYDDNGNCTVHQHSGY